jgi:hypothetical protein
MTARTESARRTVGIDSDVDPILPEQFVDRRRRPLQPEQHLMAAVLEDALNVRRRGPCATGRSPRLLYAEVRRWFASNDIQWPFSFVNICQGLGLDPSAVRAAAQELDADGTERRVAAEHRRTVRSERWTLVTVPAAPVDDRLAASQ